MFSHKWRMSLLVFLAAVALTLPGVVRVGHTNLTAVEVLRHLSPTTSCAPDQVYYRWDGSEIGGNLNLYARAAVAAAEGSDVSAPPSTEWDRDPRLYDWFQSQISAKHGDYEGSLHYLRRARTGRMLEAQGHPMFYSDPVCVLIVWTLAHEIGGYSDPTWVVQHLAAQDDWPAVAEAYERLLRYEPGNAEWRLILAQAYLTLDRQSDARLVLQPLLNSSSSAEREAAEELLTEQQ